MEQFVGLNVSQELTHLCKAICSFAPNACCGVFPVRTASHARFAADCGPASYCSKSEKCQKLSNAHQLHLQGGSTSDFTSLYVRTKDTCVTGRLADHLRRPKQN
jgi:hypothetical protein